MGLGFLIMVRVKSITRDELSDPSRTEGEKVGMLSQTMLQRGTFSVGGLKMTEIQTADERRRTA
jgi:hypothetical protein